MYSSFDYTEGSVESNDVLIVNSALETMWKEVAVA